MLELFVEGARSTPCLEVSQSEKRVRRLLPSALWRGRRQMVMRGKEGCALPFFSLVTLTEGTRFIGLESRHHGKNRPDHRGSHNHSAEVLKFALNAHLWVS